MASMAAAVAVVGSPFQRLPAPRPCLSMASMAAAVAVVGSPNPSPFPNPLLLSTIAAVWSCGT